MHGVGLKRGNMEDTLNLILNGVWYIPAEQDRRFLKVRSLSGLLTKCAKDIFNFVSLLQSGFGSSDRGEI